MRFILTAFLVLCFTQNAAGESLGDGTSWLIIDKIIDGDVPSTRLLTYNDGLFGKTVVHGTLDECEGFILRNFAQFDEFFAMSDPGYYHSSFTFDEAIEGFTITRLLACVPFTN